MFDNNVQISLHFFEVDSISFVSHEMVVIVRPSLSVHLLNLLSC